MSIHTYNIDSNIHLIIIEYCEAILSVKHFNNNLKKIFNIYCFY